MDTYQVRFTDEMIRRLDVLIEKGIYPSRSEAVRDAVRALVMGVE